MTPCAFAKYRERKLATVNRLLEEIDEAQEKAQLAYDKPRNPVPATHKDLIPGAVIWHDCKDFWHWQIVESPHKTGYTSVNGDGYYLNNAFVEETR